MTAVAELDLPAFDYSDPELTGQPWHDAVRAARERGWLARAEPIGFFVLEREAAAFFLRTPKATFPGTTILELQGVTEGPLWERLRGNLLDLDGDDHRRLRKLVQPAFTPPAADRHREAMRRHLGDLFEPIAGGGTFEATAALTKPYPARMIAELMGAPQADADRLGVWANLIQGQFDPIKVANERESLERAAAEFVDYTRALLADRHDDPGDDLISQLIAAEEEGDRLSADEVVHLTSAILVGGVDTTQAQLAHALILFARPPRPVGAPRRAPRARAAGRRGAPALRADHPDHGADHARGDRVRRTSPSPRAPCSSPPPSPPTATPRPTRSPSASTSPRSAAARSRSPSAPAPTSASAPTSPAPSSRRRSPSSPRGCPASRSRPTPSTTRPSASTRSRSCGSASTRAAPASRRCSR